MVPWRSCCNYGVIYVSGATHHVTGLVFGVLTLTWVFSGLVSMNPRGFLESGRGPEASLAQGPLRRWKEIKSSLEALRTRLAIGGVVSLASAPLGGRLYWMATFVDGRSRRLDVSGLAAPATEAELAEAGQRIAGKSAIAEQDLVVPDANGGKRNVRGDTDRGTQ